MNSMKHPRQTDRAFGYTLAGVIAILSLVGWWAFDRALTWPLSIAAFLAMLSAAAPGLLMPLNRLFSWIAPKIAHVNNTVVLGAVYYGFVTPVAFLMRIVGRDPLHRRIEVGCDSYWTSVGRQLEKDNLSDQF